jgi:hypothetical protein
MGEVVSACLIFFITFAARFSFKVFPCFFALPFWGDLSDMTDSFARRALE